MRRLTLFALLLAAVALIASPAVADSQVATAENASKACAKTTDLGEMSQSELADWASGKGLTLTASSAQAEDLPLCPRRISCDPCGLGDGPCFLKEFGSDACCISPTGPCYLCPEGTTIQVVTCPCVGLATACPRRDQDWFCG